MYSIYHGVYLYVLVSSPYNICYFIVKIKVLVFYIYNQTLFEYQSLLNNCQKIALCIKEKKKYICVLIYNRVTNSKINQSGMYIYWYMRPFYKYYFVLFFKQMLLEILGAYRYTYRCKVANYYLK